MQGRVRGGDVGPKDGDDGLPHVGLIACTFCNGTHPHGDARTPLFEHICTTEVRANPPSRRYNTILDFAM